MKKDRGKFKGFHTCIKQYGYHGEQVFENLYTSYSFQYKIEYSSRETSLYQHNEKNVIELGAPHER